MEDDDDDVVSDDDPTVSAVAVAVGWFSVPPVMVLATFDDNLLCFELYAIPSVLLRRNVKMNAKCVGSEK